MPGRAGLPRVRALASDVLCVGGICPVWNGMQPAVAKAALQKYGRKYAQEKQGIIRMKAWVLHGIGNFRFEEVEMPQIAEDEVLIAVRAAGICGSDIPRIYRTGAHVHPLVLGHEFSGIVAEVGAGADSAWKGRRVGVFPLIPCGDCVPCRRRQYEMCRSYGYLGSRRDGGFSEYAAVPVRNLIRLPDTVSFEEAAMLEPMAVAVHAMRRVMPPAARPAVAIAGGIGAAATADGVGTTDIGSAAATAESIRAEVSAESGFGEADTVAVYGLGTIGLLLLMFLLDADLSAGQAFPRILAIGNKESQRRMCAMLGLPEDCYCDSRVQDAGAWIMERTKGLGADVSFECVGKNETFARAVDCAAPGGRICLVGNPYSEMLLGKEVYWKILRNQLTVAGTWNSSFTHGAEDDWNYVLDRLSGKRIVPGKLISHRYPLEELGQGFHIMRDKRSDYVKIMGIIGTPREGDDDKQRLS